jgi:hypothetical protein
MERRFRKYMNDIVLLNYLKSARSLSFDQIDESIRYQAILKGMGEFTALGEILIEKKYLVQDELSQILKEIQKEEDLLFDLQPGRPSFPAHPGPPGLPPPGPPILAVR